MWNVYSLIKSGAINPVLWESSLDRSIRLAEEGQQRVLVEITQSIPGFMSKLESELERLGSCLSDEELFNVGSEIDVNSRDIAMRLSIILSYGGKLVNGMYDKAVLLIKQSGEFFKQYSGNCFDIFADSSKMRIDYLTGATQKYQPELIKNHAR